jgi:hypothetical protein
VLTNASGSILLVGGWPVTDYSNIDHRCINAIGALSPVKSQPGPPMTLGNAAAVRAWLTVWWCLMLALSGCSTKVIDIICPPAGVCPNTQSGHGGGY